MARLEIDNEAENSMVIASGSNVLIGRHFGYQLSDKKAKSNLMKSSNREALEIHDRQGCIMMDFSTGAYLELVTPSVDEWKEAKTKKTRIEDLNMEIEDVIPSYDENMKHVETIVKFRGSNNIITVTCYNTTQRMKAEGKGYINFVDRFLKPLFSNTRRV